MDRLLRGALAVEKDVLIDLGGKRVLLPELFRNGDRRDRSRNHVRSRRKRGHRRGEPADVGVLVIHITIGARSHTGRAQLFQTGIELLPDLAEFLVGGVAEGADGEFHAIELHVLLHESLVESHRRFGCLAVTPCRNDHKQVLGFREIGGRDVGHVFHYRLEAALLRFLHRAIRQLLGVSALGAIKNGQFPGGNGHSGDRRGGTGGKKSTQPAALQRVESGKQRIQRLALVG